jgi:hypothetical protein
MGPCKFHVCARIARQNLMDLGYSVVSGSHDDPPPSPLPPGSGNPYATASAQRFTNRAMGHQIQREGYKVKTTARSVPCAEAALSFHRAVNPHAFRSTVATHWHKIHPDQPEKPQRHLTHKSYEITRNRYIRASGYAGNGLIRAWERYKPRNERARPRSSSAGAQRRATARTRGGLVTVKGKDGSAS